MLFKKPSPNSAQLAGLDIKLSKYINIIGHYDQHLLRTKQNQLIAIIQLSGLIGETKSSEELQAYQLLWSDLYTSISNEQFSLYCHTLQKLDTRYPGGNFSQTFAHQLNESYKKSQTEKEKFKQE